MNYRPIYRSFKFLLKSRQYSTKVPLTPNTTLEKDVNKETVTVNESTIALLERLSLVKFDTKDGVKVLEDSINFANKILHIDTNGVEPLYTVLEKENLSLREDKVTQGNCQADILKNAMVIEDDYFVAPPGNIPLHEITTTPSIFLINDMKQEDNIINVNITANFPWGQQVVESIKLNTDKSDKSCLVCKLGLETALLTIMLDAASNGTKEGYVRLHNKLAPYKFSFAFNLQDDPQQNQTMVDLAKLINYKLTLKKISTWLPKFSFDLQDQMLQLNNSVLSLNSLIFQEQIHIADLESYAQILCKN
ncbi:uncharacterized protein LOC121732719 [Aricia agestis]|uniref:uncharacterized protein LOC121732719 n=1 Tax=Aricia agestis TaxID=91739 RepID=UPI001C2030A1|nr:uncharacterized protein LOC121732719 [Aricia agestis]